MKIRKRKEKTTEVRKCSNDDAESAGAGRAASKNERKRNARPHADRQIHVDRHTHIKFLVWVWV